MVNSNKGQSQGDSGSAERVQGSLIDLLNYIEQVEKLNRKPAFTVPTEFFHCYQEDMVGLPGVEFNLEEDGNEVWARISRLKEIDPPKIAGELAEWIVLDKNPDREPTLRVELLRNDQVLKLDEHPAMQDAFKAYVAGPWHGWAEAEKPRRKTIGLYNRLFTVHQALQAEGAEMPLELVWGIGMAQWRHPKHAVSHPLLTQLVEVSLDTRTLGLDVRPRQRPPALEGDAFALLDVPGIVQVESTWRKYRESAEITLSPFDENSFKGLLKTSVGLLDPSGIYWPEAREKTDDRKRPVPGESLAITDTWVLYARKRAQNFLIEDLTRLKAKLEAGGKVPSGPAALVSPLASEVINRPEARFRGVSYGARHSVDGSSLKELYFPKPYNEEQVSIIEKLESATGVVVQGPPGTGKTHTIANVICHYLANGKRVLVTSKGEPALSVVQKQIPTAVKALTVALLTDEKDGMRQFEHAIQEIAAKVAEINPNAVEREIAQCANRIDELHAKLSVIDHEIGQHAGKQLKKLSFQGRELLPYELARYVVEQADRFTWFPDKLSAKGAELKFSVADINAVRKARLAVGKDLQYLGADLPAADNFVDAQTLQGLHDDLVRAGEMTAQMSTDGIPQLVQSAAAVVEKAQALYVLVREAKMLAERIYNSSWAYTAALHAQIRKAGATYLASLEELFGEVLSADRERQVFTSKPVELGEGLELSEEFLVAVERAAKGKNPLGLIPIGKAELKLRVTSVLVAGLQPQAVEDWQHVFAFLRFRRKTRALVARWNGHATEMSLAPSASMGLDGLRELSKQVEHIYQIRRLATDLERRVYQAIPDVFGTNFKVGLADPVLQTLATLENHLAKHLGRTRLSYAATKVSDLLAKLAGKSGPIIEAMRIVLSEKVGQSHLMGGDIAREWSECLGELRRLAGQREHLLEVERVASLVQESGAPIWAEKLRVVATVDGSDPWTPVEWLEAWNWRHAATYLEAIDSRQVFVRLQQARKDCETDLAKTYQKVVEERTWLAVYNNSPPAVKAALQAYLNAVKRIGKGTGIRAVRYRREARAAMEEAYRAVPCWIMPQWRVSETLPAEIGNFHLVIVDEASQSDLWALPCLLRGDKLLVVGDDKQVSPEGVGLAEASINDLKLRFLTNQVHADQMTPEKSLYDLAKVVFAGEFVMLKEHFRCVAPIIEFSKREFYDHKLKPLRLPKKSERLDPPLIDVFVKGGTRNRDDVNEAEARAILQEIEKILRDPTLEGRTIGVVSLLGMKQAHRIATLVDQTIAPDQIVKRQMMFGDARIFQGNERDIIMLSMVAAPGRGMVALTRSTFEQRFNVAASRARDRMYLFRSIERMGLSDADLRAKLIDHFHQPFHQDQRRVSDLRELCESDFERAMYDELVTKGYRVVPQVKVGGYSIDMVIEGDQDRRLAIECDGDQYHGPEKWGGDMARQRILERAGWAFWRCFASSFALNRELVISDLVDTLRRMGIEPIKDGAALAVHYCESRICDPFEVAAELDDHSSDASLDSGLSEKPSSDAVDALARAETLSEVATTAPTVPQAAVDFGPYSDSALAEFLTTNRLKSEDLRPKGGALWVSGSYSTDAAAQLKSWGFRLHIQSRRWWRK